ncbi:MAG: hypothetical protein KME09_04620 [Pleurocapsa minor HA4230-MV1]|jgi:hypothetical protein|nr:hypothetical protein [Pleurocapsa minor HA4230-MV1]
MDAKPFSDRLKDLGWTPYKLAQELDKVRQTNKGAGNYTSTVMKFLENPNNSRTITLLDLVTAMEGEIVIRWKVKKEVTVDHQEIKI